MDPSSVAKGGPGAPDVIETSHGNEHSPTDRVGRIRLRISGDEAVVEWWFRGGEPALYRGVVSSRGRELLARVAGPLPVIARPGPVVPGTNFRTITVRRGDQVESAMMPFESPPPELAALIEILDSVTCQLTVGHRPGLVDRVPGVVQRTEPL